MNHSMINDNIIHGKIKYMVFGLTVLSDFIFDELPHSDAVEDVILSCGKTPSFISGEIIEHSWYQANEHQILMQVENVAKFFVSDGKNIVVEPASENVREATIKLYLFGVAFAALLIQRHLLPIHGGACIIGNKCIIVAGDSGAGKSTLCIALRQQGYSLLSDDIAVLSYKDDGTVLVNPSYSLQKVTQNTAIKLNIDAKKLEKIEGESKYYLPMQEGFADKSVPLEAIIEIIPCDVDKVIITEVKGIEKLMLIISNTYYLQFIKCFSMVDEHFERCSDLSKKIKIYRLFRPKTEFTVNEQIELIMNEFNGKSN